MIEEGEELLDEDGYPTEIALKHISSWEYGRNYKELMDFVGSLWTYPKFWDCFTDVEEDRSTGVKYLVSTGGWGGNEDLICALQENTVFWTLCWYSSRRGGHYEFKVRVFK